MSLSAAACFDYALDYALIAAESQARYVQWLGSTDCTDPFIPKSCWLTEEAAKQKADFWWDIFASADGPMASPGPDTSNEAIRNVPVSPEKSVKAAGL